MFSQKIITLKRDNIQVIWVLVPCMVFSLRVGDTCGNVQLSDLTSYYLEVTNAGG